MATPANGPLRGTLAVPGDKSISHRAVLFAAMAEGVSHVTRVADGADVRSTMAAVRTLGASIARCEECRSDLGFEIVGWGSRGPRSPGRPVFCGNSGTTVRLLLGVLAGWGVDVELTGDPSLSRRPMERVMRPLSDMGARFTSAPYGTLPVRVRGGSLQPILFESPIASAQVKTAVLLAGLRARGTTLVHEPAQSRDHTERLLPAFGVPVGRDEAADSCWVEGPVVPRAADVGVPGDPSSAAFLLGGALIVPGGQVTVTGMALNTTRTGFLRVLERMGAGVTTLETGSVGAEIAGDVTVSWTGTLRATTVTAEEVPSLVDEVPLLAVVATQASGTTRFEGVAELRVKESDRLDALAGSLDQLGASVRSGDDWLEVDGPARLHATSLGSLGDHRLAMAYAVAALAADGPVSIDGYEGIAVSWPGFTASLAALAGG